MAPAVKLAEGLSITLSNAPASDQWMAVAVVVTKKDHRHRITFSADRPMETMFNAEIVKVLRPILDGFSDENSVYSAPDFELSVPGLTVQQLRVIYSQHADGAARVLIRFAVFTGNPHRALLVDDGFSHPHDMLTSKVYRDALDWVLMPALNIVSVDESDGFSQDNAADLASAMGNLRASKERLLFQVELIKRELGRLESHSYAAQCAPPLLKAAEPEQEEFRTLRIIRDMD